MRKRAKQSLRPYFEVGHQVRLQPDPTLHPLIGNVLQGYHATIVRIEQLPDPAFLEIHTPEAWSHFLQVRRVTFFARLNDPTGLDDWYKENDVVCRYRELRSLSPTMTRAQLADYCQQRQVKEQGPQRRDAYQQIFLYMQGNRRPNWPLSELDRIHPPEKGHEIDLINRLVSAATKIRSLPLLSQNSFEAQAQVCEELATLLIPRQRARVQQQHAELERRLQSYMNTAVETR